MHVHARAYHGVTIVGGFGRDIPDREEVWDNFGQADKHMVYGHEFPCFGPYYL